jgi:arginine/lysine/ornithine decarboxylase
MVISVKDCFYREAGDGEKKAADGIWLSGLLREKYHLEIEMAGADYVLAILTCFDTDEGLGRLKNALLEIDKLLSNVVSEQESLPRPCDNEDQSADSWMKSAWERPQKVMELAEAAECEWEEVRLCECEGSVSTEFIYLYPPGIPIVAPGEIVTREIIARVGEYKKKGFPVQGMADEHANMLRTVKKGFKTRERSR